MFLKKNKKCDGVAQKQPIDKNRVYALILAGLIIFWTIASVFGFIGYARSSKKDSGMITASAAELPDTIPSNYYPMVNNFVYRDTVVTGFSFWGNGYSYQTYSGRHRIEMNNDELSYNGNILVKDGDWQTQADYNSFFTTTTTSEYTYSTSIDLIDVLINDVSQGVSTVGVLPYGDCFLVCSHINTKVRSGAYGPYITYTLSFNYYDTLFDLDPIVYTLIFDIVYSVAPSGNFSGWSYVRLPGVGITSQSGVSVNTDMTDNLLRMSSARNYYVYGYDLNPGGSSSNNGEYTFFNLISAVIDAPIQAFTGLLNFEVLGINLKYFLLSLFTVGLCLAVIRLIL